MGIDKTLPDGKRLPYCKYPGAADTEQHGLQLLPDVLTTVNWDKAQQYRSSNFKIIKVDSLGVEKLLEMIRVIAHSFAVNDPTLRHLNLPKKCPVDLSIIRHKDPLGHDNFADWTKENLISWTIRLFFITDQFSPLEALENNIETIRLSLAVVKTVIYPIKTVAACSMCSV